MATITFISNYRTAKYNQYNQLIATFDPNVEHTVGFSKDFRCRMYEDQWDSYIQILSGTLGTSVSNLFNSVNYYPTIIKGLENLDVSNVEDFGYLFAGCKNVIGVEDWNVCSATNMSQMFQNVYAFYEDLSGWKCPNIPYKPGGFDLGAGFQNQTHLHPQWGAPCTIPIEDTDLLFATDTGDSITKKVTGAQFKEFFK